MRGPAKKLKKKRDDSFSFKFVFQKVEKQKSLIDNNNDVTGLTSKISDNRAIVELNKQPKQKQ